MTQHHEDRREWWGRLALWVDAAILHPFIHEEHWYSRFLPQFVYSRAYDVCQWVVQWDEPIQTTQEES